MYKSTSMPRVGHHCESMAKAATELQIATYQLKACGNPWVESPQTRKKDIHPHMIVSSTTLV